MKVSNNNKHLSKKLKRKNSLKIRSISKLVIHLHKLMIQTIYNRNQIHYKMKIVGALGLIKLRY